MSTFYCVATTIRDILSIPWRLKQSLRINANLPTEPTIIQIGLKRWKMHNGLLNNQNRSDYG